MARNPVAHFLTHSPAIKNPIYATSRQTTHPFSSLLVSLCSLRVRKERTHACPSVLRRGRRSFLLYSQSASAPCVEASIRRDYRSLWLRYRASSFFSFALSSCPASVLCVGTDDINDLHRIASVCPAHCAALWKADAFAGYSISGRSPRRSSFLFVPPSRFYESLLQLHRISFHRALLRSSVPRE